MKKNKFLELILFLLIVLIPLHMVMVDYLKLLPGTWKEFLLVLAVVLWFAKGVMDRKLSIKKTKINLPLCLFIFWCIFLLLVDINNFGRNVIGLRNLLQYSLVFLLAVNLIKDKSWFKKYILLISIVAITAANINTFLFLFKPLIFNTINKTIIPSLPITGTRTRMIPVTFSGAEYYAYYISMISCLLIGFLLFVRSKLLKIILMAGIGSLMFSLLLTRTRGAVLALFAGVVFYGLRYNRKLLFAVLILTLIIAMLLPAGMYERYVAELLGGSFPHRVIMVRDAFLVAVTSPVWGIGLGNVGAAALTVDLEAAALTPLVHDRLPTLPTPHNYYSYLMLQISFIGLILYLWILMTFLKTSISVFRRIKGGYFKGFMAGIIMFFIAFSVSALFVGIGEAYISAPFYWLFGGFVMILDKKIPISSKLIKDFKKNGGNN